MPDSKSSTLNTVRAAFMRKVSAPHISPLALKLVYLIAFKHMDTKTGTTRVSQKKLARELGIKDSKWADRQVHRLLDILKPLGLVIVHGSGRGQTATYWIDPDKVERGTPESGFKTDERGTPESGFTTERGTPANRKGDKYHPKRGTPESAPLKKNLQEETPRRKSQTLAPDVASLDLGEDAPAIPDRKTGVENTGFKPKASEVHDNVMHLDPDPDHKAPDNVSSFFPEFWAAYPKKVGKAQAEKAFAAKIKRGVDPAVMIAGAKRTAAERIAAEPTDERKRHKYTKDPATWINGECWLDETAPSAPVTIDQHGNVIETPSPRRSQHQIDEEAEEQILADNAHWSPRR